MNSGLEDLRGAFGAWSEHNCEAALASMDTSEQTILAGVNLIGQGMARLWQIPVEAERPG